MTVAEGVASILLWSVNIGLACVLIFVCVRRYRLDALRHHLFVCRDELFDLALDGTLNFNDEAYVMLRQSINRMLRFSHKFSLARVLLIHYLCRGSAFDAVREAREREWSEALRALPNDDVRDRVQMIRTSFLLEVVKHTIPGWCLWIWLVTLARFSKQPIESTQRLAAKGRLVEIEARRVGDAKEESDLMPATA